MRNDIFGYFENASDTQPVHDPGLDTICPFCAKPLQRPLKTISLMGVNDGKSYFYRAHKLCYENSSEDEISQIEGSLIDNT